MFDELYERKKLEGLDLTDDVIEIIIRKKKANYEQKMADTAKIIEVIVDEIPEVEEPTFYPPEPAPEQSEPVMEQPTFVTIVEAVMAPIITKRRLPWQRK